MAHRTESVDSRKPSPRSILLLAGVAGACWLIAALALVVALTSFADRHDAHGIMFLASVAFAAIALVAGGVALAFGVVASSRFRRLLSRAEDAA
jgi:uncharacterized membrane protein